MTRTAVIAGATGLIGSLLLPRLLADARYHQVIAVGRRAPGVQHPKLQLIISELDTLDSVLARHPVDDVFCSLGTTIAKAGSRAAFAHVDHDLVVTLAKAAQGAGCKQFLVVSAIGASARSTSFYNRTKGEMEDSLKALQLPGLHVFQPSLLLGERTEHRLAESLAQKLTPLIRPLLQGRLSPYQPVTASTVAEALQAAASRDQPGIHVHRAPFDLRFSSGT